MILPPLSPRFKLFTFILLFPSLTTYNITRMGLVKGVPVDWSMQELVSVSGASFLLWSVIKARRLNRNTSNEGTVTWVATQSVVLKFRGQIPGSVFP
ncbi:unnamed protein product [Euphydryas editha]|uniref:Secreted protein n=1 Tax=Euphydryas editha TaxID=104508 RepID=A0AAU9TQR0_EUPED|nr:unnamed protein product [Euphydryas editha]